MWGFIVPFLLLIWMLWRGRKGRQEKKGLSGTEASGKEVDDNEDNESLDNTQASGDAQISQNESQPGDGNTKSEEQEASPEDTEAPEATADSEEEHSSLGTPDPGSDDEETQAKLLDPPEDGLGGSDENTEPKELEEEEEETRTKVLDSEESEDEAMPQASHETDSEPEAEIEETEAKRLDTSGERETFENAEENASLENEMSLGELIPEEFQEELSAMSMELNVNEVRDMVQTINEFEGTGDVPEEGVQVIADLENNNPADPENRAGPTAEQLRALLELGREINVNSIRKFVLNINRNNIIQAPPNQPLVQIQWQKVEQLNVEMERLKDFKDRAEQIMSELTNRIGALEEDARRKREELQAQVDEGRRRIEALERDQRRQEEQVQTFVIRLEERLRGVLEAAVAQLEEGRLEEVIQSLLQDFNIRLLGINCGLSVLMDVPAAQWEEVRQRQLEIQNRLRNLFPESLRQQITWQEARTTSGPSFDDIDLQIGEALPVQDTNDASQEAAEMEPASQQAEHAFMHDHPDFANRVAEAMQRRMTSVTGRSINFDPQMDSPHRTFSINPSTEDDISAELAAGHNTSPEITSIVVTEDNLLLMADKRNMMVKMASLSDRSHVYSMKLNKAPWAMALLEDGLLAVTTYGSKIIYLIRVGRELIMVKRIETERPYLGVGQGDHLNMVVSCSREDEQNASIDVIDRNGNVIRTLANAVSLEGMQDPGFLFVTGSHVFVSDWSSDAIFVVDGITGERIARHTFEGMKSPRQVVADAAGNIYVACAYTQSVLVMSADQRWRRLLTTEHVGSDQLSSHGVAVIESGVLVAWKGGPSGSVVTSFEMTQV